MKVGIGKKSVRHKRAGTEIGHVFMSLIGGGYLLQFHCAAVTSIMIKRDLED